MKDEYSEKTDNVDRFVKAVGRQNISGFEFRRASHKMINRHFKTLLSQLGRHYSIEKASLALHDADNNSLRVTHMLTRGIMKSGLTLTIPKDTSLLHQILMQGFPVVDNYPELVTRNLIEKKILLATNSRSLLVTPLTHEGTRLGVLSLASPDETAFGLYLEGVGQDIVGKFASELGGILIQKEPVA
jgi:transcriptional regulator with GAF, ATPase, and Fis domain